MGLDYIRSNTGKPWKKRWNGGLDRLKRPTLFDLSITETSHSVTVELAPGTRLNLGDTCIVERGSDDFAVTKGLHPVGRIRNPSSEISAAVIAGKGFIEARVTHVGLFGDTAEVNFA
ncbi:hypothetical protein [Sinorhizobium alkalisoli]|uniref:hypothetical protein n=1 Tax=Sinorhizobium alkalisoli TaxID=1752398 RepID=UPI00124CA368|nr:hypothetical protein [Sinorhizobium alkalisoli]QFI70584.1 hypothetical protein EKH55_5710 [Sinorhizobium alkalisoli]